MRRRISIGALAGLVVLGGLLGIGGVALAGDSAPVEPEALRAPETVKLEVVVIEMSNAAARIDPKLRHLKTHFARSFKAYKAFKHVASHELRLVQNRKASQAVNGKALEASYLGRKGKLLRVEVKFDGARMTMKVRPGALWFHAGRRTKAGSVTVLALKAHTK